MGAAAFVLLLMSSLARADDVPAHEPMVFDEELDPLVWKLPQIPAGHVRMRGVYRVTPDPESKRLHAWTGEARSATYDFQLLR